MPQLATIATIESLPAIQREGYARHYSTLAEYHAAMVAQEDNAASQNIDEGREPFLVDEEALEFSMHPLITIYDVLIEKQGEQIGISWSGRDMYLPPSTLLDWRG